MPKIEVNEKLFFELLGEKFDYETLEQKLICAKAELDEKPNTNLPQNERMIKIELNDTNRPDLWSTGGLTRCLKLYAGAPKSDYSEFLSTEQNSKDFQNRVAIVGESVKSVRPFMVAFVISGKPIDEPRLKDIIQTQEKLCWNFGRKRKSIAMGVYRMSQIKWPIHYDAVDPDKTSFVPLQCENPMTCRQILTEHPKGRDFGWILQDAEKFPLLTDDSGEVLSMPPIINSASLGAVQIGDSDLMVELTGSDMPSLLLSANIVACDFFDAGFKILPVKVCHPYETGFGKEITTPFFFQQKTKARLLQINKTLGVSLTKEQILPALEKMGNNVEISKIDENLEFLITPPPYRNDFLHEVDVIEDVMIGIGQENFLPESPHDFTIGKLLPITLFSRKVTQLMVGLGYQEMVFNYLGAKKDFIEKMNISADRVIQIANPMSENYEFIRPSILASLLRSESISANAIFPHKIFEVGKIAFLDDAEITGTKTIQSLGFLTVAANANFNTISSEISALLYFLDCEYKIRESNDPRFIVGRQAEIFCKQISDQIPLGIFGEIHPQVLENWSIAMPCAACELNLENLLELQKQ